jgi:membrane-bound lytic murein transglycosylase B
VRFHRRAGAMLLVPALLILWGSVPRETPPLAKVSLQGLAPSVPNQLRWSADDRLNVRPASVPEVAAPPVIPVEAAVSSPAAAALSADPSTLTASGIPDAALTAYQRAARSMAAADPGCHLPWQLLAAIGRVESNHGRFGGSVMTKDGKAVPPIYGVRLDGTGGFAAIPDTDGGALDGDAQFDRAVGPMQFLPASWRVVGRDGNRDGAIDPQDINDAALAAGVYLCAGPGDMKDPAQLRATVFRYNHAQPYVDLVVAVMEQYGLGGYAVTTAPAVPVDTLAAAPAVPASATGPGTAVQPAAPPPPPAPAPAVPSPAPPASSPPPASPSATPTPGSPGPSPSASPSPSQTSPAPSATPSSTASPLGKALALASQSPSGTASPAN